MFGSTATLQEIDDLLDTALADGIGFSDSKDAIEQLQLLESIRRKASALAVRQVEALEQSQVFREDGHASAKVMVRHVAKLSNAEAAGRHRQARMLAFLPDVAEAFAAGSVGVAQVDLLGRVHANPRVRVAMIDAQDWFLAKARRLSCADFELAVREWERLADMDGAAQDGARSHDNRKASLLHNGFDLSWKLDGSLGSLMGTWMNEIFDHYIAAERLADWEKARAEHGDDATESHLERTEPQRRADALSQIFHDAAAADGSAVPADFVHNVVWSAELYEAMLAVLDPADPTTLADVHVDPDDARCETIDGVPLEPVEAAATSLVGKMRRVVVDAAGVVIDLGRARRFTGSARTAARLSATHCPWPGCSVPTSQCEIDHTIEHARDGPTDPHNGGPFCGRHNRWKQKGFRVWRDPTGEWHTYRPDGTEIE